MDEWRPIASAPKDQEVLVASKDGWVTIGKQVPRFAEVYGDTSEGWYSPILDRRINPAFWMPLPAPPIT